MKRILYNVPVTKRVAWCSARDDKAPSKGIGMLVLTRKVGQRIQIGHNITLVVTRIAGNRVTLGIEAPDDVPIRRAELEPVATSTDEESEN